MPPASASPGHFSITHPHVEIDDGFALELAVRNGDQNGLRKLFDANGGREAFSDLRADQAELAAALSTKVDDRFLRASYDICGAPMAGVASAIDLGEEAPLA